MTDQKSMVNEELSNVDVATTTKDRDFEEFINDILRKDLQEYDKHLQLINSDINDYIQLQHTIETIIKNQQNGFKTQVNIGGNFFLQAKVENTEKILINIGLNHYLEFTLDEALKFIKFKVNILTKQSDVIREGSLKTRANIKLALMCMNDDNKHRMLTR